MTHPTFRFAPSPNGLLHLGHAFSALLNQEMSRRMGGRCLLRIENIDPVRSTLELEAAIRQDLSWIGFAWEEPVLRQSERMPAYGAALDGLKARSLVYPCFCSRGRIAAYGEDHTDWPRDPDGAPRYPGLCRMLDHAKIEDRIAQGEPHVWRLAMDRALTASPGPHAIRCFDPSGEETVRIADPARWGDAVLARKDVPTSYHLSVVVDDAFQGITHVVRGRDLEAATDLHVLLQALLGLPSPLYHHHALILDSEGRKLSKSLRSQSLRCSREQGDTPREVRTRLGFG